MYCTTVMVNKDEYNTVGEPSRNRGLLWIGVRTPLFGARTWRRRVKVPRERSSHTAAATRSTTDDADLAARLMDGGGSAYRVPAFIDAIRVRKLSRQPRAAARRSHYCASLVLIGPVGYFIAPASRKNDQIHLIWHNDRLHSHETDLLSLLDQSISLSK